MSHKNGLLALSPIILMATLFAFFGIAWGDFYKVPLVVVFAIVLIYAVCISRGKTISERIEAVSTGAGDRNRTHGQTRAVIPARVCMIL